MKYLKISALGIMAMALGLFTSCVEDKTHNADTEINVVKFENIESRYTAIANIETVTIDPKVTGSLYGEDESNYRYVWTMNTGTTVGEVVNTVIGTERKLVFPVNLNPGSYTITFRVYDKTNGMEYEKSTTIEASTPFVKGYYLYGAKEDGLAAMDFVSFIGKDTTIVRDVFKNEKQLKNPKNLIFMGYYYSDFLCNLWATSEDDYAEVESSPNLASFSCMETDVNSMCYPTLDAVKKPLKFVDMYPHATETSGNNSNSRVRLLFTENEIFSGQFMSAPEIYANPVNRYATTGAEGEKLYKPAPYAFIKRPASTSVYSYIVFDRTNHEFAFIAGNYAAPTSSQHFTPSTDLAPEGSFFWDQKKYDTVRDIVYGYSGMNGRCYALMNDANGKYYVYQFVPSTNYYSSYCQKVAGYDINMDIATDIDKATNYAFFTKQPYLLYTVGSKLYVLDYSRNRCEMVKDFGDEISYLAMDMSSEYVATQFRVCTYSTANKGNIYKYNIADDVNNIKISQLADHWKTDLRVVKFEYRNSSYGKKIY